MKRMMRLSVFSLLLCLFSVLLLAGCGEEKSGSTISEPEITGDYLAEEYSQQLITDGAETMLGSVDIEKDGNSYKVHIAEKEVVPSSDYEEGYYIADTNVSKDVTLGEDQRIACLHDGELVVETADHFIKEHANDSEQLYTVYLMGDSAELILGTDPKDLELK